MKKIILSGSMAYDRTMNFPDLFKNHLLADQLDQISVSFMVDGATEDFGGTAGNIAFGLKLMGEDPLLSATLGRDHFRYTGWLDANGISRDMIVIDESELTAGCYITNDKNKNQFTIFNPGAMKQSSGLDFDAIGTDSALVLVSPGNLHDMLTYPAECLKRGIEYIFDPGQNLPVLPKDQLIKVISRAKLLIVNKYECNLIIDKTGLTKEEMVKLAENTIVTRSEEGSELFKREGGLIEVPPCKPETVLDPTGAGDAYRAGLVSGLMEGKSLHESALQGSVCGSFAVECNGTQNYRFTRDQFERRLSTVH
ncbi:MAG: carbohydrate kinase family protein [Desulforhopalus sp.]|nr:carbohydrate kinase family protein [Desulforhopalus sp.]